AIALVKTNVITTFEKAVGDEYLKVIGYPAEFYVAQIGDGSKKL
ncbi:MAG TPA: galactokinase, partial [Lactovum miscens]